MPGSEAGHVWPTSLKPGRGTKQVQLRALTRDKVERVDMSGSGVRHIRPTSLEPGLEIVYVWFADLVSEESG
jgi:hypothetical protein